MESEVSPRTINIIAALEMPAIFDAYERIGIPCLLTPPKIHPMISRGEHFMRPNQTRRWQERRFEGAM